jgi:hypothetical protein
MAAPNPASGTTGLPPWDRDELPAPPVFHLRNWTLLIGPGLVMAGSNVGGGEWLFGPVVTARYGGTILWIAQISILVQVFYNLAIMRYALYCGENIFAGFFRTWPGPRFWAIFYMTLDFAGAWPYLASNAAVPLAAVWLGHLPREEDAALVKNLGYAIFLAAFVPLIFGGKIYNMIERILVAKLFLVLGYLGFMALFWVSWDTWREILSGLLRFGALPAGEVNWGLLAGFAAIAGAGGLYNTTLSGYVRDKGWGMGARVGAIPSAIGGRTVKLSHTGKVFDHDTPENRRRWLGWLRHIRRDQLALWAPGCIAGIVLPAMMSYEFIRGAQNVSGHAAAGMTARAIADRHGELFWYLTLLCGFLILAPTQVSQMDGIVRRWTDVVWIGWKRLHRLEGNEAKRVYYCLLAVYGTWGLIALRVTPSPLVLAIATGVMVNFAFAFSALHTLWAVSTLLPPPLRPGWFLRAGLIAGAVFYFGISAIALRQQWPKIVAWLAG